MHGVLDCNSFYASCERLFRPDLENKPVAVLSNNDGCVIAMSSEAKEIGIRLGTPYFKCRALLKGADAEIFSSNFALYGDISARVMDCLREHLDEIDVYSIDEAFFDVPLNARPDTAKFLDGLRTTVLRWCGVPVSIGAGSTRTLAKVANRLAKKGLADADGIHEIDDEADRVEALRLMPVCDVWGIGRRLAARLRDQGIETALDFSRRSTHKVRSDMGLAAMLTLQELNGEPCIGLGAPAWRKSIIHSRMFPRRIKDLERLVAVARLFAARVSERARSLGLRAGMVNVHITTGKHVKGVYHGESRAEAIMPHSHDSWEIMGVVESLVRAMHRPGRAYAKAGITLLELSGHGQAEIVLDAGGPARARLLGTIDRLNLRYGRNTVRFGGLRWRQRQMSLSPQYSTSKSGLPVVL